MNRAQERRTGRSRQTQRRTAAVIVSAAALLLAGCGSSSSGTKPASGGTSAPSAAPTSQVDTITVAAPADVDSLDPQDGPNGTDYPFLYPLYDTLIDLSPTTLAPEPGLATSWKSVNSKELDLTLRTGVTFQDGTPFNAAAVAFDLLRYKKLGIFTDLQSVASVTAVGATKVEIKLSVPDNSVLTALGDRAGMMISPTAVNKYGKQFGNHPVGTGPYEFVSRNPGSQIVYKKYPGYWGGGVANRPAQLIFKVIENSETAANALISGQVNYAYNLNVSDLARLKGTSGLTVDPAPTNYFYMLYLNLGMAPLNNKDVRLALNYAIDRPALLQIAQNGLGKIATLPVAPGSSDFIAGDPGPYSYNPTKAKQLLAASGQKSVNVTMVTYATPIETKIGEVLSSELAQVGINLKITSEDLTTGVTDYFTNHKFDAASYAWSGRPASLTTYTTLFGKPSFQNPGNVALPGMEAALASFSEAQTPATRTAALKQMNAILNEYAPYAPLFYQVNITAFRSYLKGNYNDLQGKNIALRSLTVNH